MPEKDQKEQKKIKQSTTITRLPIFKVILIILNIVVIGLSSWQIYNFVSKYKDSSEALTSQGRKLSALIKSDEITLTELNPEDLPEQLKNNMEDITSEGESKADKSETADENDQKTTSEDGNEKNKEEDNNTAAIEEEAEPEPVVIDYNKSNLSIIITEIGLRQEFLDYAKQLPKEVTFAFSPYSDDIQSKIDQAKEEGREVLLNIMFEPANYPLQDSGPLTIQSHFEETQNIYRLQTTITNKEGFIGFLTNIDEIITHNLDVIAPVLLNIKEQGKFFLFYKQAVNSYLEKESKPMALDIGTVNYLLDTNPDKESVRKQLNIVKKELLKGKGSKKIVVAIRPYKNSIEVLKEWLDKNLGQNIQLAPISYFITDN